LASKVGLCIGNLKPSKPAPTCIEISPSMCQTMFPLSFHCHFGQLNQSLQPAC
jgi:hypothetical protein